MKIALDNQQESFYINMI